MNPYRLAAPPSDAMVQWLRAVATQVEIVRLAEENAAAAHRVLDELMAAKPGS